MTRTIQQAAEFCAREFLGCEQSTDLGSAGYLMWFDRAGSPVHDPEPSWPFFGALWEECKRRGWEVQAATEPVDCVDLCWGGAAYVEGEPREAIIRAVEQWLDAREGE